MPLNLTVLFCCYFAPIYRDNFDDESPFHPDTSSTADRLTTIGLDSDVKPLSIEKFQEETNETFIEMMNEIKVCSDSCKWHVYCLPIRLYKYRSLFSGEKFQYYHSGW